MKCRIGWFLAGFLGSVLGIIAACSLFGLLGVGIMWLVVNIVPDAIEKWAGLIVVGLIVLAFGIAAGISVAKDKCR